MAHSYVIRVLSRNEGRIQPLGDKAILSHIFSEDPTRQLIHGGASYKASREKPLTEKEIETLKQLGDGTGAVEV